MDHRNAIGNETPPPGQGAFSIAPAPLSDNSRPAAAPSHAEAFGIVMDAIVTPGWELLGAILEELPEDVARYPAYYFNRTEEFLAHREEQLKSEGRGGVYPSAGVPWMALYCLDDFGLVPLSSHSPSLILRSLVSFSNASRAPITHMDFPLEPGWVKPVMTAIAPRIHQALPTAFCAGLSEETH